MIKLVINEKGLIFQLPGTQPLRTPVEINISKYEMSTVMTALHHAAIKSFQIISTPDPLPKPKTNIIPDKKQNIVLHDDTTARLQKIENLLQDFILQKETLSIQYPNAVTEKQSKEKIEVTNSFIPSFDIDQLATNEKNLTANTVIVKEKTDIQQNVRALKSLKGENK